MKYLNALIVLFNVIVGVMCGLAAYKTGAYIGFLMAASLFYSAYVIGKDSPFLKELK